MCVCVCVCVCGGGGGWTFFVLLSGRAASFVWTVWLCVCKHVQGGVCVCVGVCVVCVSVCGGGCGVWCGVCVCGCVYLLVCLSAYTRVVVRVCPTLKRKKKKTLLHSNMWRNQPWKRYCDRIKVL